MLSPSQIESYRSQGFLVLKGLVDQDCLHQCNDRFLEYANESRSPVAGMKLMKDVMVAKGVVEPQSSVHAINKLLSFENDDVLMSYVLNSAMLKAVRSLVDNDLYSIVTNVFNKPPEVDGRHPLHQDLRYFRIRPPEGIVAVWTAISPTSRANGCLAVVPESHKLGLLGHEMPDWEYVNYKFYGISKTLSSSPVHIEMNPGDTILFHPLLVHGSGRNRTNDFRRTISAHYASAVCESPPPDWRDNEFVRRIT
ncbi:MAG: phytanoyl-CoA dioxygenase family protein [Gammaproteobacteria bacterium]|nr:phytanoyl-CoA dioxygenase family protein [Gammaproteobacteria bacterium]